jgi:hypothetical protein
MFWVKAGSGSEGYTVWGLWYPDKILAQIPRGILPLGFKDFEI